MLRDSHGFEPFPQNGRGFWQVWHWEILLMESEVETGLEEGVMIKVEKLDWDIVLTKVISVPQLFQWNEDFSMGPEVFSSKNISVINVFTDCLEICIFAVSTHSA